MIVRVGEVCKAIAYSTTSTSIRYFALPFLLVMDHAGQYGQNKGKSPYFDAVLFSLSLLTHPTSFLTFSFFLYIPLHELYSGSIHFGGDST